ncbi:hypothetical protein PLEOSDRAFT_1092456 [Pleurotus ostreatus PC15]|uniref:Cytochrome b5 heme-binding domain-containing protein n=1 Tax=Pleurotus ostreatus (strain PC15) TaxID=1137138 RepID=A0A067NT56_PLEO1|nr:hypothetical protein PLEOSDRAFT_1092456 [Pleurotus ostreatus PC15]
MPPSPPTKGAATRPPIWWTNGIFFVAVHVAAVVGAYRRPLWTVPWATIALSYGAWQLGEFGITIGYHRLYSHRAFRANFIVRAVLALLGASAFQGSIKRFTDDPVQDPYAATRGLFYSHMGWIFFKPNYGKLEFVDRNDLDSDPVPLALSLGLLLPTAIGSLWRDSLGAFVWAGLVSRLAIWHCTFLVNSLAHWEGLQPYSDEDTSRGNLHAFPHDYRSGPSILDWDPSKWVIILLHQLGLVRGLRRARKDDLIEALEYMQHKNESESSQDEEWVGETWTIDQVTEYAVKHERRCILVVNGYAVDVTSYLGEHPGGASLLRKYAVTKRSNQVHDASWAFSGGLNNHSRAARKRLVTLALAKLVDNNPTI